MQPRCFLRYRPRGPGLTAALVYLLAGEDVCGWYAGVRDHALVAAFFALPRFPACQRPSFLHSMEDDLHGAWLHDRDTGEVVRVHSPLSEAVAHDVLRVQLAFAAEWLFRGDDPYAAEERAGYERLGLPLQPLNVRSSRLERFDRSVPPWQFCSDGVDMRVVAYVGQRWPLEEKLALRAFPAHTGDADAIGRSDGTATSARAVDGEHHVCRTG